MSGPRFDEPTRYPAGLSLTRRHRADMLADELELAVEDWADEFSPRAVDAVRLLVPVLRRIAEREAKR